MGHPRVVIMVMTYTVPWRFCASKNKNESLWHILVCESPLALKSTSFTFIEIAVLETQ